MNIINSENCFGNIITNSKNVYDSYEIHGAEDTKGVIIANGCKDVMWWYVVVDNSQKVFEWISCIANYNFIASIAAWESKNIIFSFFVPNSDYIIGCSALRQKKYCILNKEYNKEDWEKNAKMIIEESIQNNRRWEFLDPDLSPFPYNDTVANEHYPVKVVKYPNWEEKIVNPNGIATVEILEPNKFISEAIINFWWAEKIKTKWRTEETEINVPENAQTINSQDLPDISNAWDDILNKVIVCEVSGRPFKLQKKELEFYRKHNLPIPRKHYDIRHEERLAKVPKRDLILRNCDKCGVEMISIYPQNSKYKVYCELCYNKEIYG